MNRHEFQQVAKKFRAGKISLTEFTLQVLPREGPLGPDFDRTSATSIAHNSVRIPSRSPDCHKGDLGHVLIIGGSLGMAGAPALSGLAALRSGAGRVSIATPDICVSTVASFNPCLMTFSILSDSGKICAAGGAQIDAMLNEFDVIAIGPGLGRSKPLDEFVARLYRDFSGPLICDADALNALASVNGCRSVLMDHVGPRVLTPHPGEFKRLVQSEFHNRQDMLEAADELARVTQTTVVLKGQHTQISDGMRRMTNLTGNPGMATAGSGDVLTGIIAALIGQGLHAFDASLTGCQLHGLSGDLGVQALGQHSLIATDIIEYLHQAFMEVAKVNSLGSDP